MPKVKIKRTITIVDFANVIVLFFCYSLLHFVLYVVQGLVEEAQDVGIIKGVDNFFTILGEFYEVGSAQQAQLVRDGGMGHVQGISDAGDAHFLMC